MMTDEDVKKDPSMALKLYMVKLTPEQLEFCIARRKQNDR